MLTQKIVSRLRQCLGTQNVFGAAEYFHALEQTAFKSSPVYFVIPNTETAQGANELEDFRILNQIRIVAMVEPHKADHRKEAAFFDAKAERENIFRCVLGWRPDACFYPTQYVGGALLDANAARLFYAYTFNFPEQIDPNDYVDCEGDETMKLRLCIQGKEAC